MLFRGRLTHQCKLLARVHLILLASVLALSRRCYFRQRLLTLSLTNTLSLTPTTLAHLHEPIQLRSTCFFSSAPTPLRLSGISALRAAPQRVHLQNSPSELSQHAPKISESEAADSSPSISSQPTHTTSESFTSPPTHDAPPTAA